MLGHFNYGARFGLLKFMQPIIIVSRCIKIKVFSQRESEYTFHFKGIYQGKVIKEVRLMDRSLFMMKEKEEYLIYFLFTKVDQHILYGEIVKIKNLDEAYLI